MPDESQPLLSPRLSKRTPWGQVAILWIMRLAEPVALISIFPWINTAIAEDPWLDLSADQVGYYSGFIESCFALGQALTAVGWGRLSDQVGRRPAFILTCLGTAVCTLLMGFARSFPAMAATRFACGLLSGVAGPSKVACLELSSPRNAAVILSILPVGFTIGVALGSLIGGMTAKPAEHIPIFADSALFKAYPYLLPCALSALFPFCALILVALFFKETNTHRGPRAPTHETPPSVGSVLKSRQVTVLLLNYVLLSALMMCVQTLMPLFSFSPIDANGLGLSSDQIGLAMSWYSFLSVFALLGLFPWLHQRIGAKGVLRTTALAYPLVAVVFPLTNWSARAGHSKAMGLFYLLGVSLPAFGNLGFGANDLLLNASTPSKQMLGTVFGMTSTLGASARCVGPTFANSMYALSAEKHLLGGQLVWLCVLALGFLAVLCAARL